MKENKHLTESVIEEVRALRAELLKAALLLQEALDLMGDVVEDWEAHHAEVP